MLKFCWTQKLIIFYKFRTNEPLVSNNEWIQTICQKKYPEKIQIKQKILLVDQKLLLNYQC